MQAELRGVRGLDPESLRLSHDALYLLSRDAGLKVVGIYGAGDRLVTTASLAGIGLKQLGERAAKLTRMGQKPFTPGFHPDRRKDTTRWYMTVFADVRKPLEAPPGVNYESRQWLYSSDIELHTSNAPRGLGFVKGKNGESEPRDA